MVGAWHGHGMASVNQTRPHCVNQMGKTRSKPLATRHGRGTAWARHATCESAFKEQWHRPEVHTHGTEIGNKLSSARVKGMNMKTRRYCYL